MRRVIPALIFLGALWTVGCLDGPGKLSVAQYGGRFDSGGAAPADASAVADTASLDGGRPDGSASEVGEPPDVAGQDVPPVCNPDPLGGDWCDGLDNDCDGLTDEDGGPPAVIEDFKTPHGWLRQSPAGTLNHNGGLVPFAGYVDADTTVWVPVKAWRGDLQIDVRLVLSAVSTTGELFVGTLPAAPATPEGAEEAAAPVVAPSLEGRTGISIVAGASGRVSVRAMVMGEVVASAEAAPSEFLSVMMRFSTAFDRVTVRLLRGDGLLVAESVGKEVGAVPTHGALAIAAIGNAVMGSVTRVQLGPGLDCGAAPQIPCESAAQCEPAQGCAVAVCNPFLGCMTQEKHCPLAGPCVEASVCDAETGSCTTLGPKPDGSPCDNGQGCVTGSSCVAGACEGGEPVTCGPPASCFGEVEGCSVLTSSCDYPALANGTPCDDGDLCTGADQCGDGSCEGTPKPCPENGPCESESVCEPATGECSPVEPLQDGSGCDDGDDCTISDQCIDSICEGLPNPCDDGLECTLDACVDGGCSHLATEDCVLWASEPLAGPITGPVAMQGVNVYVVAGGLYGMKAGGEVIWQAPEVTTPTTPTPVVGAAGLAVYVGDVDAAGVARLASVSAADGALQWAFSPEDAGCTPGAADPCRIEQPPTEGQDGTLYVATTKAGLFAVTATGEPFWRVADVLAGTSVVVSGGQLVVGQGGPPRGVHGLNTAGDPRWLYPTAVDVRVTPLVVDGAVYYIAGSSVGALTDLGDAVESTWSLDLGSALEATQAVLDAQGRLVVASQDTAWALDPAACDGTSALCVAWTGALTTPGTGLGMTALGSGAVMLGGATLRVLSADGAVGTQWGVPGQTLTSPTVMDGLLIVGSSDGILRGYVWTAGDLPAETGWPVFQSRQSRNALVGP